MQLFSKWNLHGLNLDFFFKQIYNLQADKAGKKWPFNYMIKNPNKIWLGPE